MMDRYVEQLIEDLRSAARNVPERGRLTDTADVDRSDDLGEHFAQVEQYLHGKPQKLSEIVGLESIALPPPDKLSGAQMASLYGEMADLLNAFHFFPDFPELVPVEIRYHILRNAWDQEYVYVGAGEIHMEFCHYDPAECPFPQAYCDCKNWESKYDNRSEGDLSTSDDDSLPF